jgi:lipoprotein-releasing system ATP-binding protein
MSKVQKPRSTESVFDAREERDPGPWTLDVGLNVVDLRKSFVSPTGEQIVVLRGVTFRVKPGETIAVTGASGSGKSTLLHLLGGLEEPDHGSITMDGTELPQLVGNALPEFRQKHIGFVFQFHYLLPDLSAIENVALPLLIARRRTSPALTEAAYLLREMGLESRLDHPISHLSGGEQQRVAVARALIAQPKLLLADEPTGNLDAAISEEIGKTLVNYTHKHGGIAVIATHSERLAQICDRKAVLVDGRAYPG